jgi:hypothetical protein
LIYLLGENWRDRLDKSLLALAAQFRQPKHFAGTEPMQAQPSARPN